MAQDRRVRDDSDIAVDILSRHDAVGHAGMYALAHPRIDVSTHALDTRPLKPRLLEPDPVARFEPIRVENGVFSGLREI